MDEDRHVEVLDQLPERPRLVVVRIMSFVIGLNQDALEAQLSDRALGFLDLGRAAARQDGREAVQRAFVLLLDFGGIVRPALDGFEFVLLGFAAHVVRGVADDTDRDAGPMMGIKDVLDGHRAFAGPGRSAFPVPCERVGGGFFGGIDVGVPFNDHVASPSRSRVCRQLRGPLMGGAPYSKSNFLIYDITNKYGRAT